MDSKLASVLKFLALLHSFLLSFASPCQAVELFAAITSTREQVL